MQNRTNNSAKELRRKNRGEVPVTVIVGIVIAVLIIAALGVFLFLRSRTYTAGEMKDNTYKNRWAKVKAEIPEEWVVLSEAQLKEAMAKNSEGFDMECPAAFYKMSGLSSIAMGLVVTHDGKMDLDEVRRQFEEEFGVEQMLNVQLDDKNSANVNVSQGTRYIGGEEYLSITISMRGFVMEMAFKECHDNGIFGIAAMCSGNADVDDVFRLFGKY